MTRKFNRSILFLADGARPDVLQEEMRKGNLPNLSRYLAESGTNQKILTVFPSTTGPAYLPFLTGCYPGTCNVPGIRWFDKKHYAEKGWSFKSFRSYVGLETFLMNKDLRPNIRTAFEIFNNPVSVLNMINRGVHRGHNKTKHSRIWYVYYAHLTDHWAFVDQSANHKLLSALDEDPDFSFVVYPAIDEYSHRSSPFHPRTVQAYQEIDLLIGQVIDKLKKKGWLEDTLLTLVSDHGLSDTSHHFDIGPYLEEKGLKTFYYTQIFKRNFKAASMVSGNGMAHLYFENKKGWEGRTYFEDLSTQGLLLDELRMRPEIGLVASQGADGAIHVQTEKGHGTFRNKGDSIDYAWDKEEPLGLEDIPSSLRQCQMTPKEALLKTWNSHLPDVFQQLSQLFTSPRSGDVIVSARSGFDLREKYEHPEHKASHGSLCPEHMFIPLLMNYPIPLKPIRSVDIFPTILELLGRPIPQGIDGQSLVSSFS